ncbi:hypothetical protein M0R72_01015 [Candidatus Pacearchaeota archaeon]|jgi:hypothetical protein|nr:hypothetical protein [Candidatus Pacearchaeota archaeon]
MTTVKIHYLGEIETATGKAHDGWTGGFKYNGHRVDVRRVEPTTLELDICPFTKLSVGWGDRGASAADLAIWGETANGSVEYSAKHGLCINGYFVKDSVLELRAMEIHSAIVAAAQLAEETRPNVSAVCAQYRSILKSIAEEHERHYAQWKSNLPKIARKFRRKKVLVGEQTVPGKCCVRSVRGNLLGYVDIWNGKWLETVERITA